MTANRAVRRAARLTALAGPPTVLTSLMLMGAPALADTPAAWEDAEPMSTLTALVIFVGIPLALFIVISVLTIAPSLMRGDRRQRGATSWTEPAWFGNEGQRSESGRAGSRAREIEGGGDSESGGASARW